MCAQEVATIQELSDWFERSVDLYPNRIALLCNHESLTYLQLEEKSNQLAHYLSIKGVRPFDRVGILLERSIESYIALLAVAKLRAIYVPIEAEYPDERINYIVEDMAFQAVIISQNQLNERRELQIHASIIIDPYNDEVALQSLKRPRESLKELACNSAIATFESEQPTDSVCYVIYTSGSTGKPKGVQVTHRNICHYIAVASKIYEITNTDRIYQGFSLGFDASLEEIWMAFANGSALIACTSKETRSGIGLIEFLEENRVTVFSTVPALLATLDGQLPHLRLLILGGEACPAPLVKRWHRPGLRILNTYGPTETTIVATYAECHTDEPITIGKPLPGYEIAIVDTDLRTVSDGDTGELCIAGHALALGYVNQKATTAEKFINLPNYENKRFYRTGDMVKQNKQGNLIFLGRLDNQIKLRGFRIELNEIETIIEEYPGIQQAVVSMQILEEPTLVAYLLPKANITSNLFDLDTLKAFLKKKLPHYMFPRYFQLVENFPLLSSGKVDRKQLPKPSTQVMQSQNYVAPKTKLEKQIAKVWKKHLAASHPISVNADFFYELGGHSLIAANVISSLRQFPEFTGASILDLYKHSTIQKLAKKLSENAKVPPPHRTKKTIKNQENALSYYLCGFAQACGCLLQYAIGAWQLLLVILCYSWVESHGSLLSKQSLLVFTSLFLSMPILSLALTITAKWLLIGRIKPGIYRVWGWFYFRWWLVERLQKNVFSPKHLIGSPLIIFYYRLLGAKIGKNCYIGSVNITTHDLLTIGDNSSVGFDARLLGYVVEDGWLKIGRITIGKNCYVGARSVVSINTTIEDEGKLDDMSLLPAARFIPSKQFYSGSPAAPTPVPEEHLIHQLQNEQEIKNTSITHTLKACIFGILHYTGLVWAMMMYYLCYFPALFLVTHFQEQGHYISTLFLGIPLGAVLFLSLHFLSIGICKKLLMSKIKPGTYSLQSLYYLRQWITVKMVDIDEVYVMADSLYIPYFMRFLGAKLGKHVEMGETPHINPDLVTIQDEGFVASSVALAWPNVYLGKIKFAPVEIGKRGFIGNMSLLPLGANIGEEGLLGCMSIVPPDNQAANHHTAWLGSPAVFLPKRELFTDFSDTDRFTPSKRLVLVRLAIEFIRIITPTALNLVELLMMLSLFEFLLSHYSLSTVFAIAPIADCLLTGGIVAGIVGLKWLLLGKLKPATKPIWNIFIWKNDLIEYLYSYYVSPHFTNLILGTPFVAYLFRAFGAKIGRKVFIDTADFTEFDLISIEDEACINSEAIIQTHLYEDRIFKMSTVHIQKGCNVGTASIVLYSTVMEPNSSLGNFSLLMKGERLPNNTQWQGIPAQPVRNPYFMEETSSDYIGHPAFVEIQQS